jgi:anti-sigma B factor antagonist
MTIEERRSGGATILKIGGRLTIEVEADTRLADTVRRLLAEGRKQIVLDLAEVPRVDTSGVCAIVEAYITTKRQGGSLKLLSLASRVREVLTITRLLTILEAYDSEADAISSFGSIASA